MTIEKKKRVRVKNQYSAATLRNFGQKYEPQHWPLVLSRRNFDKWCVLYGWTPEDVARAEYKQDRKCGICHNTLVTTKDGYHMDHDHKTGRFRGILCGKCNRLVGQFETYPHLLATVRKWVE